MGFLEVCVEMMDLAGTLPESSQFTLGFAHLLAAIFLALNLKRPTK